MKNWKKNLMAAAVLLVVCAGIYMNWMYADAQEVSDLTQLLDAQKVMSDDGLFIEVGDMGDVSLDDNTNTITDYFAAVRLSRQEARDSALELLQEAMAYGDDSEHTQASAQLESIIQTALTEAQIESLIVAKGYADCVAYMSENGISVAVASPEGGMQADDIAVIADVVITQTGLSMENIRVVEVQ